ncbi:PEP-CTERM sorting domain-containing protein [Rheinheimera gaetbuli]
MKVTLLAAATLLFTASANATIITVFDSIPNGSSAFDTTVLGAGGTVYNDVWATLLNGSSLTRPGYTVTRNNGGNISQASYGTMSGRAIDISPNGSYGGTNGTIASGITFTFDNAINSFGFEVGDWATCCFFPTTDLFISFDDGAPIQVASASQNSDGRFLNQFGSSVYEIFVAAFDDTGFFNKVQFWGNGSGEYLVVGGQVKYGLVNVGSLPPSQVSAPASVAMLMLGLFGIGLSRRKKTQA